MQKKCIFKFVHGWIIFLLCATLQIAYSQVENQWQSFKRISDPYMRFESYKTQHGLSHNFILDITQDNEGYLWIATREGLNRFDGYNFVVYKNIPGDSASLSDNWVTSLTVDSFGDVWAGTKNGLNRLNKKQNNFERFYCLPNNGLTHNFVRNLYTDKTGRLWILADNRDLCLFDYGKKTFTTYTDNDRGGINSLYFYKFLSEDEKGNILVGGPGTFKIFNPAAKKFSYILNADNSKWTEVNDYLKIDGTEYLFTNWGILYKSSNDSVYRFFNQGFSVYDVEMIDNTVWIVGYFNGVSRLNLNTKTSINHRNSPLPSSLPANQSHCIFKDRSGCIWIGTINGLAKYTETNKRFRVISASGYPTNSLAANHVTALEQDKEGLLWAGTLTNGLHSINLTNNEITRYTNDPENPHSISGRVINANSVFSDKHDNLWVGLWETNIGVNKFDKKTKKFADIHDILKPQLPQLHRSEEFSWSFGFLQRNDTLFSAQWGIGIHLFKINEKTTEYLSPISSIGYWFNPVKLSHDKKKIWATNLGMFDIPNFSVHYADVLKWKSWGLALHHLKVLTKNKYSKNKTFWVNEHGVDWQNTEIVEYNGIAFYSAKAGIFACDFNKENGDYYIAQEVAAADIPNITFDKHTGKIICVFKNKITCFDPEKRTFSDCGNDLIKSYQGKHEFTHVYSDSLSFLWLFTPDTVFKINPENNQTEKYSIDRIEKINKSVETPAHDLWLATSSGLLHYSRKMDKFTLHTPETDKRFTGKNISSLDAENNDRIWFGNEYGLYFWNTKTNDFLHFTHNPYNVATISSNLIGGIVCDSDSLVWVSTDKGMVTVDYRNYKVKRHDFIDNHGTLNNLTTAMTFDKEGRLWCGNDHAGLSRINVNNHEAEYFYEQPYNPFSFSGFSPSSILCDSKGRIWIGTEKALNLYLPEKKGFEKFTTANGLPSNSISALLEDAHGNLWISTENGISKFNPETKIVTNYHKSQGLPSNNFTLAATNLSDGQLAFGTIDGGLVIFHPDSLQPRNFSPPIAVTSFVVNGNQPLYNISENSIINLPYSQRNIEIEFAAFDFDNSDKIIYQFILEGYDSDYTETGADRRYAKYTNLPAGKYVFKIKATNSNGVWNEKNFSFTVNIKKPWWATLWAYFLYALIAVAIVFLIVRWRTASLKEKQKELEQTVKIRTAEVVHQKELVEEKNKKITDSIQYALRIQTAILPPEKLVKEHLKNSFVLYMPKDIVAGDFYWMETVEFTKDDLRDTIADKSSFVNRQSSIILFAACDCTGHGVPGAMVSVMCHNALNRAVREYGLTQPAKILDKVTELVQDNFSKSEDEIQDGMDASLCALHLAPLSFGEGSGVRLPQVGISSPDQQVRLLEWAGANNPLWIIRNGEIIEYKPDKQPIGKYKYRKPYTNHQIELQQGDTIYIFSDGYHDQFGDNGEKKLTKKGLKQILLSIQHLNMEQQREELVKLHSQWKGQIEQIDDICVIGVRV